MSDLPSQPAVDFVTAFNAAAEQLGSAPAPETPEAPEAPAATAAAPEVAQFDPATIRIPETAQLPEHAQKYRGKSLAEVIELERRTQQYGFEKAQEAAQARREADELRARLAAAEQLARMNQKPPEPEVSTDPWTRAGVDPNETIITDPRRVAEVTISEAERRSIEAARQVVAQEVGSMRQQIQREREEQTLIATFELAKHEVRKAGHNISDDDWVNALRYIGPAIEQENRETPGVVFDPKRYVAHYTALRGVPARPTLPTEGNPPVAARSAAVAPESSPKPSVSREKRQLYEQVYGAMKGAGLLSDADFNKALEGAGGAQ